MQHAMRSDEGLFAMPIHAVASPRQRLRADGRGSARIVRSGIGGGLFIPGGVAGAQPGRGAAGYPWRPNPRHDARADLARTGQPAPRYLTPDT